MLRKLAVELDLTELSDISIRGVIRECYDAIRIYGELDVNEHMWLRG